MSCGQTHGQSGLLGTAEWASVAPFVAGVTFVDPIRSMSSGVAQACESRDVFDGDRGGGARGERGRLCRWMRRLR
jgi:hypothetical protein